MTKTIRTGICSYGMSGKLFHAPFIEAHPGFELTGIVERNREESRNAIPTPVSSGPSRPCADRKQI